LPIRRRLAEKLNQIAWGMVTAPEGDQKWNPEQGLTLATRAVELDPQLNYIDTLAEALLANGKYGESMELCLETLAEHPEEQMFLDRLKRLEQLTGREVRR
jgi:hypothetical protein